MNWKFAKDASSGAQPAPATHALPPPTGAPAMPMPALVTPPAQAPAPAAPAAATAPAATAPPAAEAGRRRRRSASEIAAANAATASAPPAAPAAALPPYTMTAPAPQQQQMFAQPAPVAQQPAQPAVYTPTVIPSQPAARVPATIPAGGFLALFTPKDPGRTAGAAVAAVAAETGGALNLFPTVDLTGGSTGGMFDYNDMNEEGSDDDLPNGRKEFVAIMIGYRHLFLGWPAAYVENGPKRTPRFRGVCSSEEGETADLLTRAFKKYQFRTRGEKGAAEPFFDERLHPAACVEALMFLPSAGVICVRSTWTYDSFTKTNDQVNAVLPIVNGQIAPTPVVVSTSTWQTPGSKSRPGGWPEHCVLYTAPSTSMKPEVQTAIQDAWGAFQRFYAQAGMDPQLNAAMADWAKHDMPVQALEYLREIVDT